MKFFTYAASFVVLAFAPLGIAAAEPGPHQRLMHYADEAGREQPVQAVADWQPRRAQIIAGMERVMGPLPTEMQRGMPDAPAPAPLDLRVLETVEQEGVPRQTISFASRNGERVTAYLWVPRVVPPVARRAAILALQPTGDLGKGIVAGYGRANRGYGLELAQRGYVVIAPDYVSFGDAAKHDFATDDYVSGTMKGIVDNMRCVDYLQSRDDVDGERIGVIGHSLGGHNSLFVAAFDPRIKAVVSSCGWDPFHHYYDGKKLANWAQERYMPKVVADFAADPDRMPFDFYEVVGAMAPRPFLSVSPRGDSNFQFAGVKKAVAEARKVYELYNVPLALQARYPDCPHDFPDPQRREAYAFLDAALKHKPTARVPDVAVSPRTLVHIKSTADGTEQPSFVIVPRTYDAARATPLLVSLHSWSGDLHQRHVEIEAGAEARGWLMVLPNFRGPNNRPEACGSKLAQQDILDAVEWMCANYNVDRTRIYLTGSSGGGHMTMQMVGNHPHVWAAASAWVGLSDLKTWHARHARDNYGAMLRNCCGGAPGDAPDVDEQYRLRSPITHLAAATKVPLEIAAGIYDGHNGSVPVRQSLEAFNVVAAANGDASSGNASSSDASSANGSSDESGVIDEPTIERLSERRWWTNAPSVADEPVDAAYDRTIYFRRTSGSCRVTLFEGGHERLDAAALAWLEKHGGSAKSEIRNQK